MTVTDCGRARSIKHKKPNIHKNKGLWQMCMSYVVLSKEEMSAWSKWSAKLNRKKEK